MTTTVTMFPINPNTMISNNATRYCTSLDKSNRKEESTHSVWLEYSREAFVELFIVETCKTKFEYYKLQHFYFYNPSSDGVNYVTVLSVRTSGSPSGSPGFRPSDEVRVSSICVNFCFAPFGTYNTRNTQFSALFFYMLWQIELKFCIWFFNNVLHIKCECRQFASIFVGIIPLEYWKYTFFRTILLHAMTYWAENSHIALFIRTMYYRSCSSVVNLCQFVIPHFET